VPKPSTHTIDEDDRPLSWQILQLGHTYDELEYFCSRARSTSWFHKLLTHDDPWVNMPPPKATLDGLAQLLDVDVQTVSEWVALEWYGVRRRDVSARVQAMAYSIGNLSEDDVPMVTALIKRLGKEDPFAEFVNNFEGPMRPADDVR
jgi:hypothetical protein